MVRRVFFLLVTILFLPLVFTGSSLTAAAPTERPAVSRFGIIESTEAPQAADELGVGWTRLSFHWGEIQPDGPDSWQPEFSDEQIDLEIASGREITGLLIGIPDWARDESDLPRGLHRPTTDPENSWATFVRRIVSVYKGRVDHWIIWNEPDIAASEIAHTWDGTVADFARLQRVAYLAAKEANSRSVIHLTAFTYWADYYAGTEQYMARLLDELAKDSESAKYHSYFDVATAHLYFQPDQIYELLNLFQGIMRERGLAQPIWLVETNAPPRNDPYWPVPNWTLSVYLDEQAAFMPQALALALAAGAERVAVYKLQDTAEDRQANPEPFGLLRQDGTKRPAFETLQVAVRQLAGMTAVQRERWNEVGQIRIDQTGQSTTVVFSRLPSPQQARVPATAPEATLLDMWGNSQPITPTSGIFEIDLPPSPCSHSIGDYCMIGGPTYYLVQEAPVPPTPTPVPPTPTAVTPSPSATATQTPVPTQTPSAAPTETSPSTPTALSERSSATAAPAVTRQAAVNDQGAALGNVVLPVIAGVVLVFGVAGILLMLLRRR